MVVLDTAVASDRRSAEWPIAQAVCQIATMALRYSPGSMSNLQSIEATVLDRVHAAMLLQASGHANALRALLGAEQDRGPEFLRLANALSALYPRGGPESGCSGPCSWVCRDDAWRLR